MLEHVGRQEIEVRPVIEWRAERDQICQAPEQKIGRLPTGNRPVLASRPAAVEGAGPQDIERRERKRAKREETAAEREASRVAAVEGGTQAEETEAAAGEWIR
jgi:hypothetical protein